MTTDNVVDPLATDTGKVVGTESSLSPWVGDYVTDFLGKGQALSELPYEGYEGPLTAGASELQTDAFGGIAGLTLPDEYGEASNMISGTYDAAGAAGEYDPSNMTTGMWNNDYAEQYMNPYVQQALNPQLDEISRQAQIQRLMDDAGLTKAGAYGGSRQAIMNSESNDNTARLMNETVGQGYSEAYNTAGSMFTSDMDRQLTADRSNEQSRQYGAGLGLDAIRTQMDAGRGLADVAGQRLNAERDIYGDQLNAGGVQRDITAEGVAADKAQFEEERDFPYKSVQFQQSLLDGLPLEAKNTTYTQPSWMSEFMSGTGGIMDWLNQLGLSGGDGGDAGGPTATIDEANAVADADWDQGGFSDSPNFEDDWT